MIRRLRGRTRRTRALLSAVAVGAVLSVILTACSGGGADQGPARVDLPPIDLGAGWTWTPQPTRTELGVTHSQRSLDQTENAGARSRGRQILTDSGSTWQNQHLMGFGALNPEPSPGKYDWSTLDQRMKLIKDTGGRTVLTACCAPDWMKGGTAGTTDWSTIETAPTPENFDAFAQLTAATVERYPQIERVQVWNELKGFFNQGQNRWDYEGYTDLYNRVYKAVKAVRSDVQIGGPYISILGVPPGSTFASGELVGDWGAADRRALDVVTYWLTHNAGADFVSVDGPTSSRDGSLPHDVELGAKKFADTTAWLRTKTQLPVWWSEFYADVPNGVQAGPATPASATSTLAALAAYAESGVSVALLWGPEGADGLDYSALWTSADNADGGRPTALTDSWRWLTPRLAAKQVDIGRSGDGSLLAFRAPDGVLVVNQTAKTVPVPGSDATLPAWSTSIQNRSG